MIDILRRGWKYGLLGAMLGFLYGYFEVDPHDARAWLFMVGIWGGCVVHAWRKNGAR